MAKKRSGNSLPPFVPMTWEMLNSTAYRELPASPAKALPYFIGKVKAGFNDPQRYQIEFSLCYREASNYGFAPATFSKVIQSLVTYGFIDPIDKGGLKCDGKSLNLFCLSYRWRDYGKPGFDLINWKCFTPRLKSKSTSKKETHSFKKGKEIGQKGKTFSVSEAVGAISA